MEMRQTISAKLMRTLQKGKARLGTEALRQVIRFVESQRTASDAFVNKNGEADVYYTSFGWILSYVLGIRSNPESRAAYLNKLSVGEMDLVHYAAYMRCLLIHRLWEKGTFRFLLNTWRSVPVKELSAFHGLPHNDSRSPYTQFIWLSLLEDTQHAVKDKESLLDALALYRVADGGYSNNKDRSVATTNATVAALSVIGQLEGVQVHADLCYLHDSQDESGGFKAGAGAPVPDLLSTATSLFLLTCYGQTPKYAPLDFIEAHWQDSGGFSATLWESDSDVEYTFYGLLALGTV